MTLAQLRRHCTIWKARLGLRDWTIAVRWGTPAEALTAQGESTWCPDEQAADIWIDPNSDALATLLHELLHVRLDGHRTYPGYDVHQERAINWITAALLKR